MALDRVATETRGELFYNKGRPRTGGAGSSCWSNVWSLMRLAENDGAPSLDTYL